MARLGNRGGVNWEASDGEVPRWGTSGREPQAKPQLRLTGRKGQGGPSLGQFRCTGGALLVHFEVRLDRKSALCMFVHHIE